MMDINKNVRVSGKKNKQNRTVSCALFAQAPRLVSPKEVYLWREVRLKGWGVIC